jgi:hypothetical protein
VPIFASGAPDGHWEFTLRGAALPVTVQSAVTAFVNVIKVYFPTTTKFNSYTVYNQPLPTDIPQPVESKSLNILGTDAGAGVQKATQRTWTFRADNFSLFKMVHLDVKMGGEFDKVTDPTEDAMSAAVIAYVTADVTWLASQGGGRPNVFLQYAETLNEKLRRSYRMQ